MAEEKKVDLSSFDGISDRVARAKAKAEAMRAAKAGGETEGGTPSSPGPASPAATPVPPTPSAEAPPAPETPSAGTNRELTRGGIDTDLSSLDAITDRVARAKAKAEAMRAAKAGGKETSNPFRSKSSDKTGAGAFRQCGGHGRKKGTGKGPCPTDATARCPSGKW